MNSIAFSLPVIARMNVQNEERTPKVYKERRFGHENNFKSLYRFKRENVNFLANTFLDEYAETRGGALSNVHKMKAFLRYVGDPGFQVGVGEDLGIHQTTVSRVVWNVCTQIVGKAGDWIKFPSTKEELESEKRVWQRNFSFPCAVGAIDCTHVLIKKPHGFGDEFVNRKGLHSFNVQATCNGNDMFTSVECKWAGSVHDARIWRNSDIFQVMNENDAGAILLGDEAYPLTPWVMTPFRNPVEDAQKSYNIVHKKERVAIERAFGQLKQRFPILQSKIRIQTDKVPHIIVACFILHNVAKFLNENDFDEPLGNFNEIPVPQINQINTRNLERGQRRRDAIASHIMG